MENWKTESIKAPFEVRIIKDRFTILEGAIDYYMESSGFYRIHGTSVEELPTGYLVNEIRPLNKEEVEKQGYISFTGTKQSEGKLNYELDFGFITQMAERMAQNKNKYEPYNWKKPIDVELLKQAAFRHTIAIMKGEYEDEGREFGHLESAALDFMMINYQLKYNKQ
jgi:hypothetical protein